MRMLTVTDGAQAVLDKVLHGGPKACTCGAWVRVSVRERVSESVCDSRRR